MIKHSKLLFLTHFCILFLSVSAESILLGNIDYKIDGTTQISALERYLAIDPKLEWPNENELKEYLNAKEQNLKNLRLFDSIKITYTLYSNTDLSQSADIIVYTKDQLSLIPLVYPDYDSNTGVSLGGQILYPNAFGSLTNIEIESSISSQYENGAWYISNWNLSPEISGIVMGQSKNRIRIEQLFKELQRTAPDGTRLKDFTCNSTGFSTESKINLNHSLYYSVLPSIYSYYNYQGFGYSVIPYEFIFHQRIEKGSVDWTENFRNGFLIDIGNHNYFRPAGSSIYDIDGQFTYYKQWGKRFNFYSRTGGFYSFNGEWDNTGEYLRGIKDGQMYGFTGFYQNMTLAFQFWRWPGLWDAQIHPFVDFGLSVPRYDPAPGFKYSCGADFVLYLDRLKNLTACGTIGYDLSSRSESLSDKVEIMISSSLNY